MNTKNSKRGPQSNMGNKKPTKYTGERGRSEYRNFSIDYALFFLALHEDRYDHAVSLSTGMEKMNTDNFREKEITRYNSMMEYVRGALHQATELRAKKLVA